MRVLARLSPAISRVRAWFESMLEGPRFTTLVWAAAGARLLLALGTTNSNDLLFFASVATEGAAHRPLYADTTFSYPPLWGYFLETIGKLLATLHVPVLVHIATLLPSQIPGLTTADLTTPVASLLIKLPALCCDAVLAYLMWWATRHFGFGARAARAAALGWWLNPLSLVTTPVQASWDSVVPLAMLLGIVLALENQWLAAGAAIAVGAAAKLTPVYFIFLSPALVFEGHAFARSLRRSAALAAGAAVAAAIVLAPIALWGEWRTMLGSVFARTETFTIGGTNALSFAQFDEARPLRAWIELHRHPYGTLALALTFAGCAAVALLLLRRRERGLPDYCLAALACLTVVWSVSPLAQPTYGIWVIPFAVLLAGTNDRRWWAVVAGITVPSFIFFLTVRAPQALLEPTCVFYGACDPAAFGSASVAYATARGLGNNSLQVTIDAIAGECTGVAALAGLVFAFRALWRERAGDAAGPPAGAAGAGSLRVQIACAGALVLASLGALAPFPPAPAVRVFGSGSIAEIEATSYSGPIHVAAASADAPRIDSIAAYFDGRYTALRGVTPTFARGFADHFRDDLQARNLATPVATLDADTLAAYLRKPGEHQLLFVLGGVLPDTVRGVKRDLLSAWLAGGGTVVWAGGPFDVVWANRNPAGPKDAFGGPDYSQWRQLYGGGRTIFPPTVNIFYPPVTHGTIAVPSLPASQIDFDRTTYPLNVGPLLAAGGRSLAYIDERDNSSVSSLPIGRGTLIFFADAFDDEIFAAQTLAQLLFTQAWAPRSRIAATAGQLSPGTPPMSIGPLAGGDSVAVFGEPPSFQPFATYRAPPPRLDLRFEAGRVDFISHEFSGPMRVVIDIGPAAVTPGRLYVYADSQYPAGPGIPSGFREATAQLLATDERLQQTRTQVEVVDADGLSSVLANPPGGDALLILGGVLPDTVRTLAIDPLKTWLRLGGTVFWAGGPFDAYFATRRGLIAPSQQSDADYSAWPEFYRAGKLFAARAAGTPAARGEKHTAAWEMWRDPFDGTTFGANLASLQRSGGTPLATIDDRGISTVSLVPVGRGRLVFFGDAFPSSQRASGAVAQAIFTGVASGALSRIRASTVRVSPESAYRMPMRLMPGSRLAAFAVNDAGGPFAGATLAR